MYEELKEEEQWLDPQLILLHGVTLADVIRELQWPEYFPSRYYGESSGMFLSLKMMGDPHICGVVSARLNR